MLICYLSYMHILSDMFALSIRGSYHMGGYENM